MAGALQHAKKFAPGADGRAVLASHDPGDLVQMREIVGGPGSKKLREHNGAERRVQAAAIEIARLQIQRAQFGDVLRTQTDEFVEQLRKRLVSGAGLATDAIKGFEGTRVSKFENVFRARNPVHRVGVHEVSYDSGNRPCILTFIPMSPDFGQIAEERVESGGSAGEEREGVLEVVRHVVLHKQPRHEDLCLQAAAGDLLRLDGDRARRSTGAVTREEGLMLAAG